LANFDEIDVPQHPEHETSARPFTRREVAKVAATGLAGLAVGAALPRHWFDPIVQVAFLPAHAAASPVTPVEASKGRPKIDVRTLQPAQQETPTSRNDALPTETPKTPDEVTPPAPDKPNPEPTSGGGTGTNTQPKTSNPDGDGAPPCPMPVPPPSAITATTTSNSAQVKWEANGQRSFELQLTEGSTTIAKAEGLGALRTFSGLRPCTSYTVYIRARCGDTFSTWYSGSFMTKMDPHAVPLVVVSEDNKYCDGFYAVWNAIPCATSYEAQISEDGGATWKTTTVSYPSAYFVGLCPDKEYKIKVRALNGSGPTAVRGDFSPIQTVRTKKTGSSCSPCGSSESHPTSGG
jgi:hypothetical protein